MVFNGETKGKLHNRYTVIDPVSLTILMILLNSILISLFIRSFQCEEASWSWSYGSRIYNYLCNQCLSPLTLWVQILPRRGVLDTPLYDKVCQWLMAGQWFSPDSTPVSSTNKTDRHDIPEILVKVELNVINLTLKIVTKQQKGWNFDRGKTLRITTISFNYHIEFQHCMKHLFEKSDKSNQRTIHPVKYFSHVIEKIICNNNNK